MAKQCAIMRSGDSEGSVLSAKLGKGEGTGEGIVTVLAGDTVYWVRNSSFQAPRCLIPVQDPSAYSRPPVFSDHSLLLAVSG